MKRIYQTQPRKQLIEFLSLHRETAYTIEQVIEAMAQDEAPAKSSIYRLMKQLVDEGIVKRYAKDQSRQFVYQLIDGESCTKHFHLKCLVCGKLVHLSDKVSSQTQKAVFKEAGFAVDQERTLFFGKCVACQSVKSNDVIAYKN